MNALTVSLVLRAPRAKVFSYLSIAENLPRWAGDTVQEVQVVDGEHWVTSPAGRMLLKVHADEKTGVVDLLLGPWERTHPLLTRVVELPGDNSLLLVTIVQTPATSPLEFGRQYSALQQQMERLRTTLEEEQWQTFYYEDRTGRS